MFPYLWIALDIFLNCLEYLFLLPEIFLWIALNISAVSLDDSHHFLLHRQFVRPIAAAAAASVQKSQKMLIFLNKMSKIIVKDMSALFHKKYQKIMLSSPAPQ